MPRVSENYAKDFLKDLSTTCDRICDALYTDLTVADFCLNQPEGHAALWKLLQSIEDIRNDFGIIYRVADTPKIILKDHQM